MVGWMVRYRVVTSFIVGTIVGLLAIGLLATAQLISIGISLLAAVAAQQPNLSNRGL